jgi:PadR family transcriptional regulator, regulatory protein PadR
VGLRAACGIARACHLPLYPGRAERAGSGVPCPQCSRPDRLPTLLAPSLKSRPSLSDLGKINTMPQEFRVTAPLLDVLEVFVEAFSDDGGELHGWQIVKSTKRSGPTVYGVLDRLVGAGWISGRWEDENPQPNRPRRRLYCLTPDGVAPARQLLAERRPRSAPRQRSRPGFALSRGFRNALAGGRM